MSWRRQRQATILGVVLLVFLIIFGPPIYKKLNPEATCFDGKKNQDERGIDCGGVCQKVCVSEIREPAVIWARAFEVKPGVYNLVSMIENKNRTAEAQDVSYVFRLFDDKNLLIAEEAGETDIYASKIFPVFESGILTGERIPERTFFEFTENPEWRDGESVENLLVERGDFKSDEKSANLSATVMNKSIKEVRDINVTAVLYDLNGNALNVSKTFIDRIEGEGVKEIKFTWPFPFEKRPGRIEVVAVSELKSR